MAVAILCCGVKAKSSTRVTALNAAIACTPSALTCPWTVSYTHLDVYKRQRLCSGVQLFCTGIVGEYLAKTYLEVKHRPIYIVAETEEDQ